MSKGIAYVLVMREVYYLGMKACVAHNVEVRRGGKVKFFRHVSKTWQEWLKTHTGRVILTKEWVYPPEAIGRFGANHGGA